MKEQVIEKLLEYMQRSEDFLLEQVPDVLQQALRYQIISNWVGAIVTGLLAIVAVVVACYFWRNPKLDEYGSWTMDTLFFVMVPLLLLLPLAATCYGAIDNLIKLYMAPKYYLVQMLMCWKS